MVPKFAGAPVTALGLDDLRYILRHGEIPLHGSLTKLLNSNQVG